VCHPGPDRAALDFEGKAPTLGFKKTNDVAKERAKPVRAPIQACPHRLGAHHVGYKE